MKRLLGVFFLAALTGLIASSAMAADQYSSGSITWDDGVTTTGWGPSGGPYTSAWVPGNDATFMTSGGTVSIGVGGVTVHNITFNVATPTIQNFTLLLTGATPTINAAQNGIISSAIAGTAGLTKSGANTLTLSGPNTYSGGTTISAGALGISADTHLGAVPGSATPGSIVINNGTLWSSGDITLNANRGIAIGPSSGSGTGYIDITTTLNGGSVKTMTYGGIIANNSSGTGKLSLLGNLTLSGNNTYSGNTDITGNAPGATLTISGSGSLGTGSSGAYSYAGNIFIQSQNTTFFQYNSSVTQTLSGTISGAGNLGVNCSGMLILSHANTYSGGTKLSGGTLKITDGTGLGGTTPGSVNIYGGTLWIATSDGTLGSVYNVSLGNGVVANVTGNIILDRSSGSGGNTVVFGTFDAAYNGNNAEVLNITQGAGITGQMIVQFGTISTGANSQPNSIKFAPVGAAVSLGAFTPNTTPANPKNQTLILDGTSTNNIVTGVISDTLSGAFLHTGTVTKANASTWTLSNANTYSGVTTVSGGVLLLANANAIPGGIGSAGGTSAITFNGGVIGLGNGDFTRSLNTAGTVTAANFTGAGGWAAFGVDRIVNLGGASASITWATAGTGFNGQTLILGATNATNMVDLQNPIDFGNNATRTVQVDDGAAAIDAKLSGILSGTGTSGLTKTSLGTLILTNANTYPGTTTISGGKIIIDAGTGGLLYTTSPYSALTFNTLGGTFSYDNTTAVGAKSQNMGALTFGGGDSIVQSTRTAAQNVALTFSSLAARAAGATGNFIVSGGANGTENQVNLTGQALGFINQGIFFGGADYAYMNAVGTYVRAPVYGTDSGFTTPDTLTAGTHVRLTTTPGAQNSVNVKTLSLAGSGVGFPLNAGQTLTLSEGGLLKSGGGTAGIISGGTAISPSKELVIRTDSSGDVLTNSTPITGTYALTKTGAGTLTLSAANTFSGTVYLNAGTLNLADQNALTNSTVTMNGGTLTFDQSVVGNAFRIGGLAAAGSGSGSDIVLQNNAGTPAAIALTVGTNNASTVYNGVLSGAGSLIKVGTGILTLSGQNAYSGGTVLYSGEILITASGSILGTGPITIYGGTIGGYYQTVTGNLPININGSFTLQDGSNNGPINLGNGPITLGGSYTISIGYNTQTLGGNVTGTNCTITKAGIGNLNLNGNIATGSGGIIVNAGKLNLGGVNTFTGKTVVNGGGVSGNISNAGVAGALGMPTGANAIIDLYNGTVLGLVPGTSTDRLLNLAGVGPGTVTISSTSNGGGTIGGITVTGTGAKTLVLIDNTFYGSDPGVLTVTGGIPNSSDGGQVTISIPFASTHTSNQLTFNGVNTFSGSISIGTSGRGKLTIGGAGQLGSGNYANTITINGGSTFNYASSANQTLSGSISGNGALTQSGPGMLTLSGNNTYTGVTTVASSVLLLNSANALPGGIGSAGGLSHLTFNGGIIGLGNGDFTRSLDTVATFTAADFTGNGGWAAFGADRIVNLGGASGPITWATANTGFNAKTLILSATNATHMVDLQNPIDLGAATRTVQVDDGAAAVDAKMSGVLTSSGGGLTKAGFGTLVLNNADTYTGTTTIYGGGTLKIDAGAGGSLSSSSGLFLGVNNTTYMGGSKFIYDNTGASGASSQTLASLGSQIQQPDDNTVQITRAAAQDVFLTFTTQTSGNSENGATINFVVSGLGVNNGTNAKIILADQTLYRITET